MSYKFFILCLAISTTFTSCAQKSDKLKKEIKSEQNNLQANPGEALATFASGCFWCVEEIFESLKGVREVHSGYAGGKAEDANYDAVSSGRTDHAECVQIYYNPAEISFDQLTAAFFVGQDPTTPNQQGPDRGTQYRSIAFYRSAAEKEIILNEINRLNRSGIYNKPIVTEVLPFSVFYMAEDYHQNFVANHPNQGYVQAVSIPRFEKFKREFKGIFKK
ncbi:MAG: peptide-methionine (S)-S-oxide reductase MsrA [Bacteroidota bacterium]|nr:peptide-methionine (S)-S-oxide reductase MsrA [Bacteroidota bacterium]